MFPDLKKLPGYPSGIPLGGPSYPGAYFHLCHGLATAPPDADPVTSGQNLYLPERRRKTRSP